MSVSVFVAHCYVSSTYYFTLECPRSLLFVACRYSYPLIPPVSLPSFLQCLYPWSLAAALLCILLLVSQYHIVIFSAVMNDFILSFYGTRSRCTLLYSYQLSSNLRLNLRVSNSPLLLSGGRCYHCNDIFLRCLPLGLQLLILCPFSTQYWLLDFWTWSEDRCNDIGCCSCCHTLPSV